MTSYESAMLLANTLDGKKGEEIKVLKTEGNLADAYISRAVETCIQEIAVLGNGQAGIDEIAWAWRR